MLRGLMKVYAGSKSQHLLFQDWLEECISILSLFLSFDYLYHTLIISIIRLNLVQCAYIIYKNQPSLKTIWKYDFFEKTWVLYHFCVGHYIWGFFEKNCNKWPWYTHSRIKKIWLSLCSFFGESNGVKYFTEKLKNHLYPPCTVFGSLPF